MSNAESSDPLQRIIIAAAPKGPAHIRRETVSHNFSQLALENPCSKKLRLSVLFRRSSLQEFQLNGNWCCVRRSSLSFYCIIIAASDVHSAFHFSGNLAFPGGMREDR